ncbi:MAG: serine hydrolase [Candidatus Latescibacteria bacterium]|nr:serine hydrolase [Candidatus Latescibacterota bacterium]
MLQKLFVCPGAPLISALFALFLLAPSQQAHGHSGNTALAYPVSGLTLDGDLSDWPELVAYPIAHADYGDQPENSADLKAHFRIGYDLTENALYIGVEVEDQSIVIAPADSSSWDNQDGCELYIASRHQPAASPLIQYARYGDQDDQYGHSNDQPQVAVSRDDNRHIYEWRIAIDQPIHAGQSLGFDISVADMDQDNSFSWTAWSGGTQKLATPNRVGDVLLVDQSVQLGQLTGRIAWHQPADTPLPAQVRLQALLQPSMWTQASVDSSGSYRAELPVGPYTVHAADAPDLRVDTAPHVHAHIAAASTQRATLLRVSPMPSPVTIGEEGILHADSIDPAEIDQAIRAYMDFYQIPGLSLALIKGGQVVHQQSYGVQNANGDEPVQPKTLFEAASMTKPVFTYAVARLVERGVLSWDTPLYTYWPYEDIAYDERYKLITARMVVSHTTGFPNWRSGQLEIEFDPGTQFGYSGEGFEFLGKVVVHLTGKELVDLIRDEVFTPLGMDNAYLVWNETDGPQKATAHTNGLTPVGKRQWDNPMMAASLHTDPATYARFLIAVSQGVGLTSETLDEMLTPQTEIPDANAWFGLGFSLEKTATGLRFGHGGSNFGFTCQSAFYRQTDIGYVVMVNNDQAHIFEPELRAFLVTGQADSQDE